MNLNERVVGGPNEINITFVANEKIAELATYLDGGINGLNIGFEYIEGKPSIRCMAMVDCVKCTVVVANPEQIYPYDFFGINNLAADVGEQLKELVYLKDDKLIINWIELSLKYGVSVPAKSEHYPLLSNFSAYCDVNKI